jgi:hypothetical protein
LAFYKLALFFQIALLIDYLRPTIVYCLLTIRYPLYAIAIGRHLALIGFLSPESGAESVFIILSLKNTYAHSTFYKLALFFQIMLCQKRPFRISGQSPAFGFVFSK